MPQRKPPTTANFPSAQARAFGVRVPASTSNLGAGFDCFGLALQLYLTVTARVAPATSERCRISVSGAEGALVPRDETNLVYQTMLQIARGEGWKLPSLQLSINNEIPVARGLGGSAAAVVAAIKLVQKLCGRRLPDQTVLRFATEIEGHADNVAPSLLGGLVTTCTAKNGEVVALKLPWPRSIKVIVVSPSVQLDTKVARAALLRRIDHRDAVFNLQRAALFSAAISQRRFDLLWEATRDRLHQAQRTTLVPGLAEALNTPPMPGLLGVALSGAGPSVAALAHDNFESIGRALVQSFRRHGLKARVRVLAADSAGGRSYPGRVLVRSLTKRKTG